MIRYHVNTVDIRNTRGYREWLASLGYSAHQVLKKGGAATGDVTRGDRIQ